MKNADGLRVLLAACSIALIPSCGTTDTDTAVGKAHEPNDSGSEPDADAGQAGHTSDAEAGSPGGAGGAGTGGVPEGGGPVAVCGNGVVESGEACDDDSGCCGPLCASSLPDGSACPKGIWQAGACTDGPPAPPTRYVREDGQTVEAGKPTHTTFAAAIDAAYTAFQGGSTEIIEVQANTAGDTQTFKESLALVDRDFIAGRELVIRARAGDTVWVKDPPAANGGKYPLYSSGSSFWKILGKWIFGDSAGWSQATAGKGVVADKSLSFVNDTHHFEVSGDITIYGGNDYEANTIDGTCYLGKLKGCKVELAGTNNDASGTPETNANYGNDRSDLMTIYADRFLLEDCKFRHGGHNNLSFNATRSVARGCTFDGDWSDMNTGYDGARAAAFDPALDSNWVNAPDRTDYGPLLVEDSVLKNAGASSDGPQNITMKFEGRFIIFRHNLAVDSRSGAFFGGGAFYGVNTKTRLAYADNYVYNNTLVNGRGIWDLNTSSYSPWIWHADTFARIHVRNNLFMDVANGNSKNLDRNVFRWLNPEVPLGGHPTGWKSSEFTDNLIAGNATLDNVQLSQGGENATVSLYDSTQWPNNWARNVDHNVTFASPGTPGNRPEDWRTGFTLTADNDASRVAAVDLVTTRSSGTSTNVVPVTDAGYFYDGFEMSYFGEVGDTVQFGTEQAIVTARDTTAKTITVNRQVSFDKDVAVRLVRDGVAVSKKGAVQR